jgi:hypothetical protein
MRGRKTKKKKKLAAITVVLELRRIMCFLLANKNKAAVRNAGRIHKCRAEKI